ncbi:transmembrane and coiled-coil domain protein 3 isoform X1 [Chiloscyllium plagiosum]|uniref:transmembrane and coiled-coil domain protein 3 isoform X1 n=2 Tax=Chiloscyllium plagiosum TaxID=36176 RepID=UPI001CB800F4|nr:transmembrane and coiled-coil domain protein 3 isoform X1 [Chiloscyllium plagiosum]
MTPDRASVPTGDPAHPVADNHRYRKILADQTEMSRLSLPGNMRRGGSDTNLNLTVTDGLLDFQRDRQTVEQLKQKILKLTEQLRIEQELRDANVAEYLKLVNNADKQQARRVKQVFEKKNLKSAQVIAGLQKKFDHYHRKLRDMEQNGSRNSKERLRDSQHNVRDMGNAKQGAAGGPGIESRKTLPGVNLTPPSSVFSKPREIAILIRNKFGSADNIAHMKSSMDDFQQDPGPRAFSGSAVLVSKPKYLSDDECSSGSDFADSNGNSDFGVTTSPKSNSLERDTGKLATILDELREMKETQSQLSQDIENLKVQFNSDFSLMTQTLQEEHYRSARLEDQLNDLTELHQHETIDLKQELASIEEKVAYQSYERARDMQEALESCQTRLATLELHQQQQQLLQIENANAKVLLGKCINIFLAIMTVILVCISTIAKFSIPLMRSRLHVACTISAVIVAIIVWKKWDQIQSLTDRIL